MCGLSAIYAYRGRKQHASNNEISLIRDWMRKRGPDSEGIYFGDHVNMGHTRLSIIDLTKAAAQPMKDLDNNTIIVFNGEIYNFRELKKSLEKNGYTFKSNSDTEVLLHLYHFRGEKMVEDLRGMYAFVIWDAVRRLLICVRDPFGIKPLYYSDDGHTLRVASQVKALQAGGAVSSDLEPAGIAGFYLFGSVPEPYTCYRQIRSLPAGSMLVCKLGEQPQIRSFFSISEVYRNNSLNNKFSFDRGDFAKAIEESVACHMKADVPVGLFLSSGIDSGSLLGLMRDGTEENIDAVTLSFCEYLGRAADEQPLAKLTADHYRANHIPYVVGQEELKRLMPKYFEDMDQPSIDGLNTWLISYVAKIFGLKVMLSGIGGDELAGGYPSFKDIPRWLTILSRPKFAQKAGPLFSELMQFISRSGVPLNPKISGLLSFGGTYAGAYYLRRGLFMPWELKDLIGSEIAQEGLSRLSLLEHIQHAIEPDPGTPFGRIATLESTFYLRNQLLRDADWAGMAHSIEIRTPFVDAELLKTLAPIISHNSDYNYKQLLADAPSKPLPEEVRCRKKTGFTIPAASWLEKVPALEAWRRVPILRRPECHWARRWAYTVMSPIIQPS